MGDIKTTTPTRVAATALSATELIGNTPLVRLNKIPQSLGIECDVYVHVTDADALYAEYVGRNVRIVRPIEDSRYGLRDFVVEDGEGHRLVFGSPIAR